MLATTVTKTTSLIYIQANDTHTYNIRDIQTNDGNPSGVVLPDNAYGIVIVSGGGNLIGNFRILDDTGYEYRTNSISFPEEGLGDGVDLINTFNFNTISGVTLSDVVGITLDFCEDSEVCASNIVSNYVSYDIDILDNNEVPFSCRDVVFACVDEDNPLLEELLAESGNNVASFEYGINNAIPHSRGGELLCPGNTIPEGFVRMIGQGAGEQLGGHIFFIGLNNGNGRGSMDSIWRESTFAGDDDDDADAG